MLICVCIYSKFSAKCELTHKNIVIVVDKYPFSVLWFNPGRAIDKECGSNDYHLPALTLAATIHFKGLGHDFSVSLPNSMDRMIKKYIYIYYMKLAISFIIPLPGTTPSLASHRRHLFYFAHLKLQECLPERRKCSLVHTLAF